MALACAQAKRATASSGTSVTANPGWTAAAGALHVCWFGAFTGTASNHAASGSVNGTYTKPTGNNAAGGNARGSFHYKLNTSSGAETLTANGGASTSGLTGLFHEVTGADTAAAFTAGEISVVSYTATTNPQTNSVTNSVADAIFFAGLVDDGSANPSTLTVNSTGSSPTGWALKSSTDSQQTNGNTNEPTSCAFLIVASSAATKHGWTAENVAGVKGIIAFGIAGGGGGTPTPDPAPTRTLMGVGR